MSRSISDFFNRERDRLLEDAQEAIFSAGETLKKRSEIKLDSERIKGYPLTRTDEKPPQYWVRVFGIIPSEEENDYLVGTTFGRTHNFPRIRSRGEWQKQKPQLNSPRVVGNQHGTFIVVTVKGRRRAIYEVPQSANFERWFYSEAEIVADTFL